MNSELALVQSRGERASLVKSACEVCRAPQSGLQAATAARLNSSYTYDDTCTVTRAQWVCPGLLEGQTTMQVVTRTVLEIVNLPI